MHVARLSIVETLAAVRDAVFMDAKNLSQAEIGDIEHLALCLLKGAGRVRNSFVPINQLPPEILSRIFHFLRPSFGDISSLYSVEPSPNFALEKAAVVCHHWRIIALGSPELWTTIDLSDDDARVGKLLQRSGGAPLTLFYHCYSDIDQSSLLQEILGRHMHRVQDLSLDMDGLQYFVKPAPSLVRAVLMGWYDVDANEGSPPLFGGEAPLLREVTLKACLPWRACRFPSITHLCISQGDTPNSRFHDDFFSMLEVCHCLQLLVVTFTGNSDPSNDAGLLDTRVISLPDLRTLYLDSWFVDCMWSHRILSRVKIPRTCDIRLKGKGPYQPPLLAALLQPSNAMNFTLRSVSTLHIAYVQRYAAVHMAYNDETLSLTLAVPSGDASLGFAELNAAFETCTHLVVIKPAPSPPIWCDLLGALPSLQRLTIIELAGSMGLSAVCRVLRQDMTPPCSDAPATIPCSSLHSLEWHSSHALPSEFWLTADRLARKDAALRNALVVREDDGTIKSVQRVSWDESGLADIQSLPDADGYPSGKAIQKAHTKAVSIPLLL